MFVLLINTGTKKRYPNSILIYDKLGLLLHFHYNLKWAIITLPAITGKAAPVNWSGLFEAGKKINEYDMAALKRELDQKPDLK